MGRWGFFITIEGPEGSGKSTLTEGILNFLKEKGFDVVYTREPGGTPLGERIRDVILNSVESMDSFTETFLFLAARRENVIRNILPALRDGKVVVCDRYTDSTIAYQGYGRGLPIKLLRRLNKLATGGIKPDITLFIDVEPLKGLQRINGKEFDRIEREDLQFHERVREGYRKIAKIAGKRVKVLDGTLPPDELLKKAIALIKARMQEKKKIRGDNL
uniref:Thymidylate kinase n=1 Tax=candidate division WOR-3 bacterium TaxID=2052148 RepID=A0A7C2P4J3_UNCW3